MVAPINTVLIVSCKPCLGGSAVCPTGDQQHCFMEIDHKIFSMVILSFLLIQEGQLSVSGKRMCTILVNSLEY